jgi:hypothetical protein
MADIARALVSLPFTPGDVTWIDTGNSSAHAGTILSVDPPTAILKRHRDGACVTVPLHALDHRITCAQDRWDDAQSVYRAKGVSVRALETATAEHEDRIIQDKLEELEARDRLRADQIAAKVAREVSGIGDAIRAAYIDERMIPRVGRALSRMQMDPSYGAAMDALVTDIISRYIFEEWFKVRVANIDVEPEEARRARDIIATAAAMWCEERGSMRMMGGEVLARAVAGEELTTMDV